MVELADEVAPGDRASPPSGGAAPTAAPAAIRVSVLLSARNAETTVERSLRSAVAAMGPDDEIVAIDDGSTDGTAQRIEATLSEVGNRQVLTTSGIGLTRALRLGVERARGKFLARLDAGDTMTPERLRVQIREFERDPRVVLCAGNVRYVDPAGRALSGSRVPLADLSNVVALLVLRNPLIHSTWMVRRDALLVAGNYRESAACSQDYDAALRLLSFGRIRNIRPVLGDYMIADDGISGRRFREQHQEARAARARFLNSLLGTRLSEETSSVPPWDRWRLGVAHVFAQRALSLAARGGARQAVVWRAASAMMFPLGATIMGTVRLVERLRFGAPDRDAPRSRTSP